MGDRGHLGLAVETAANEDGAASPGSADECVTVAVHIRPLVDNEIIEGCQDILHVSPGQPQARKMNGRYSQISVSEAF